MISGRSAHIILEGARSLERADELSLRGLDGSDHSACDAQMASAGGRFATGRSFAMSIRLCDLAGVSMKRRPTAQSCCRRTSHSNKLPRFLSKRKIFGRKLPKE